jgi:hypothetical protein
MAEQSIQLRQIAVMFYSGDYKGNPPPTTIDGLKLGDQALDTSCSILWEYTGAKWCRKAFVNGGKIYMAGGRSLHEMITSPLTKMPVWMECFEGDDLRVPRDLQLSRNDLVIHHRMGEPPIVTASYYDRADKHWYNIHPAPGAIVTSVDGGWSMWIDFFSRVTPNKSVISLWDVGSQNPADNGFDGGFSPDGSGAPSKESPADKLSEDTVKEIEKLTEKIKVTETNAVVLLNGEESYEIKTHKHKLVTAQSLDLNRRLYLDNAPSCVITGSGDVFYMNSKVDQQTGEYILDFTGIDITGVWKVLY